MFCCCAGASKLKISSCKYLYPIKNESKKYSMLNPWICFLWIVREWNSQVNFNWNLKFVLLYMEETDEYFLWKRTIIISFKTRHTRMYVTTKNVFTEISWDTKSAHKCVQNSFFSVGMHSRARAKIFVAYFFGLIFALDLLLLLDQAIGNESNYWQSARDFEWNTLGKGEKHLKTYCFSKKKQKNRIFS